MNKLTGVAITDVGRIRNNNEDNFVLFSTYKKDNSLLHFECEKACECWMDGELSIAAVLDGVGGVDNGEVAALIGAKGLTENHKIEELSDVKQQICSINNDICKDMSENKRRMGATVAAIYFQDGEALSANLGDSRCYLYREGKLLPLSHDHSKGQALIDDGSMTEIEARNSKFWHVITKCLGAHPDARELEPYIKGPFKVFQGDRFLICSDGLTDPLYDDRLNEIMFDAKTLGTPLTDLARNLVEEALDAGGRDNVTVVLVDVVDEDFTDDEATVIVECGG